MGQISRCALGSQRSNPAYIRPMGRAEPSALLRHTFISMLATYAEGKHAFI
jgi:hypothetical protein